uniref:Uncharacterized protein n=1 Tax=Geospiza parvula TaxID=87175 RepID=A0A8C3MEV3_GEOPR
MAPGGGKSAWGGAEMHLGARPRWGGAKPTRGGAKPHLGGQSAPGEGQNQPGMGQNAPGMGQNSPGVGQNAPGGAERTWGGAKSTWGGAKLTWGGKAHLGWGKINLGWGKMHLGGRAHLGRGKTHLGRGKMHLGGEKGQNSSGEGISAHGKDLYVNADLFIVAGAATASWGPTGPKGKTTLLKHIANRALSIPPNIDVLLCEQEVLADDTPAVQAVLRADTKRLRLLDEERRLQGLLESGDDAAAERLEKVYEELRAIGAAAAEAKARRILAGLGFTPEMQNRATRKFSGGWRMRVSLARALFLEPTLLMLDEPTNHLDLNAVIWLNKGRERPKIAKNSGKFLKIAPNFPFSVTFKKMYQQKQKELLKQFEKQEKKLRDLKAGGKSTKQAEKQTKEALTRAAEAAPLGGGGHGAELLRRPREYCVRFTFPNPPPLSPPVLGLHGVDFGYEGQELLFKNLDFGIDMESRVCIVGPNGVGKSTLLQLLTGALTPLRGQMRRNHRLKVGFFNQQAAEQLRLEETAAEFLQRSFNLPHQEARRCLGRFGLEGHAHTLQIAKLSGGQKARVVFAELSCREPDVLILDEPTNNLDIESIDALADAINEYKGAVIVVSHDARLITETNCQLWVVEEQGLSQIDGDFDDYKREVLEALGEVVVHRPRE